MLIWYKVAIGQPKTAALNIVRKDLVAIGSASYMWAGNHFPHTILINFRMRLQIYRQGFLKHVAETVQFRFAAIRAANDLSSLYYTFHITNWFRLWHENKRLRAQTLCVIPQR